MSLLESIVSLVILAIASVSFLGTFQQSARAARSAEDWLRASRVAEAAMEARKSGSGIMPNEHGYVTSLAEQSLDNGGVAVAVTVQMPDGQRLVVHRILSR